MSSLRIAFGRGVCGSIEEGVRHEWLVTDGLGSYASGTVAGLRTRRYHGLLMAATAPGGASRMLGLAALDVVVVIGDRRIRLATHEWDGGVIDPRGHEHLASFDLDDGIPRWRFDLGPVQLEVELAMAHGRTAVGVVHRLLAGEARLEVSALCTWRDQHGDRFAWSDPAIVPTASGFVFESAYRVDGPGFEPGSGWYRGEFHREEAARGLGATEDLWSAGTFRAALVAGEVLGIVAATMSDHSPPVATQTTATEIIALARVRADELAMRAEVDDDIGRILAIAADRFVVDTSSGPGAVAGYPWFGEWSRDLFTSYEGLFLCTGRSEEGRAVLLRAAGTVSEGMLANTADVGALEYNTIDGTLWFLHAVGRHVERTGDFDLVAELKPTIEGILSAHRTGTRFGIGVDGATGLLRGGADGYALTWMDAIISGRPVTARRGYPVEVQALWINGLGAAGHLLAGIGEATAEWDTLRGAAVGSFRRLFPLSDRGVPDLIDESGTYSRDLRPNQLLAASLPYGPVQDPAEVARIVAGCRAELLTSIGLRSLSANDPAYQGRHQGAPADRDAAYHQGTVWPWMIGPYADAVRSSGMDTAGLLDGLELHLAEAGLGSVSETADGDAPHRTTGCPFQAWSVAELLRARTATVSASEASSRENREPLEQAGRRQAWS